MALNMGGSFGLVVHYDAATGSLALGELNGDARPEAVLTSLSDVEVWTNNGDGTFVAPRAEPRAQPDVSFQSLVLGESAPAIDYAVSPFATASMSRAGGLGCE